MTKLDRSIPVYEPVLGDAELQAVIDCVDSGWISSRGENITRFEAAIAEFVGFTNAIATSNGTTAIHLAMAADTEMQDGLVLAPAHTYIATVTPALHLGRAVHVLDVDPDTWMLSEQTVADAQVALTGATIIGVDVYGTAMSPSVAEYVRAVGARFVSDSAEALGSFAGVQHAGHGGHWTTLSFFGNKVLTTGEGGMLLTNSSELAESARKLRSQGLAAAGEYLHDEVGFNFRMTNVQAAIGLAQFSHFSVTLARKRALYELYSTSLSAQFQRQQCDHPESQNRWMCAFLAPSETVKDRIRRALGEAKIETRPFFPPLSEQPCLRGRITSEPTPVATDLSRRGFCLPSGSNLDAQSVERIVTIVNACLWPWLASIACPGSKSRISMRLR